MASSLISFTVNVSVASPQNIAFCRAVTTNVFTSHPTPRNQITDFPNNQTKPVVQLSGCCRPELTVLTLLTCWNRHQAERLFSVLKMSCAMRLCFSSQLIAPSKLLHVNHMARRRRGPLWSKRWVCYVRRKHFILCTWGSSPLSPAFLFQRKNSTPRGLLVNQPQWRLDCFWSHPGCRRER